MNRTLDYARPSPDASRWLVPLSANLTLFYPIIAMGFLYGEWLLSWFMLGHPPQPSLDDPKSISGANWMHPLTLIALMGTVPVFCAALILNMLTIASRRPSMNRALMRMIGLVLLWLCMFLIFNADPGRVIYWWLD